MAFGKSGIKAVIGTLVVVLSICIWRTNAYGFRYRADPLTGETQLWTFLPGMASPSVYQNDLLVKSGGFAAPPPNENPGLYQYRAPNGEFKWKCKPNAFYSEFFKKCQWSPAYYFAKGKGQ